MGSKSDPRRLPRRNHFQEGPGFLFLAYCERYGVSPDIAWRDYLQLRGTGADAQRVTVVPVRQFIPKDHQEVPFGTTLDTSQLS